MSEIENQFGRTLVVVAHPDDEVIGCSLLLQRLHKPVIAFLTDGAPTDRYFWGKFGSRTSYAALRAAETKAALGHLNGVSMLNFGVRDQELMFHLDIALEWLQKIIAKHKPNTIVTHAYEGGHPDHDCCSFLAAMAGRDFDLPVWEMPLYCRVGGKLMRQHPLRNYGQDELCITATDKEEHQKIEMMSKYVSQSDFIQSFETATERFYPQPQHDFSSPPHTGKLNYECWGWEVTGKDLCVAFSRVMSKDQFQRAKTA